MALTRKFLSALGIESDKVDEIINAHTETVNALKAERDEAKAQADKVSDLEKENKDLKKKVADAEQEKGKEDTYKVKYEAVKEEFEEFKKGIEAENTANTKKQAFKSFLKDLGVSEKRIDAIVKVSDLSKIEVEDGKVKDDESKLADSLKKEWEDFIVTETPKGADTTKPPKNDGGKDDDDTSAAARRAAEYYANKYGATPTKEEK